MGRPDDANPLHASLAAETIRRAPKAQKKESSAETPVTVDRKAILALNASQRQKWLSKALRQAVDGRLSAPQLYDVVSAAKFADGIEEKVGRRMCHWLRDHLTLFTNRQQRQLQDQAAIFTKFRPARSGSEGDRRQREPSEPRTEEAIVASSGAIAASETSEEMMGRIREFMRGKAHERDTGPGDDSAAGPSKAERRTARAFLDGAEDEPATSSAPSKEPRNELNGGKKSDPSPEATAAPQAPAARSASAPRRRSRSRSKRRRTRRTPSKSRSSASSAGRQRGKQPSRSQSRSASRGKRAGDRRSRSGSVQRSGEDKKAAGDKATDSTSLRRRMYAEGRAAQPSPPRAWREHKEREGAWSKRSRRGRSASSSSSRSRSRSSPSRRRGKDKKEKDKGRDKVRERDREKGKDKDRR